MLNQLKYFFAGVLVLSSLSQPAAAQLDQESVQVVENSLEFLRKKRGIQLSWFVTYDSATNADNEVTTAWNGKSSLTRGKGYYARSERYGNSFEYFYDGQTFTVKNVGERHYAQKSIEGAFDELVSNLSTDEHLTLPVWELLSDNASAEMVAGLSEAKSVGRTQIMGQDAYHVKLAKPDREWEMWVSSNPKRPVPLMIIGKTPENGGSHYQAMFYDWKFKQETKRRKFIFRPKIKDLKSDWETFQTRFTKGL